jgi:hypothetical protein
VTSFASYKSIYGTLGALPIFLLWIYVCWLILLAGALLAWRWQNGWPPLEEEKTIESTQNQLDEHRNRAIRAMLPSLVLIAIYEKFRDGRGHDITTLVEELKLPYSWVFEAVELLRELGMIAHAKVIQPDKTEMDQILPTHPADKISMKDLTIMTETPVFDWLETWEPASSGSLQSFKKNAITAGHSHALRDTTMASIIG